MQVFEIRFLEYEVYSWEFLQEMNGDGWTGPPTAGQDLQCLLLQQS